MSVPIGFVSPNAPHTVYTFWNVEGVALYVGCTADFSKRLTDHRRTKSWFAEVTRFDAVIYPHQSAGLAAEMSRIRELQPLHNRLHTERVKETVRLLPCRKCHAGRHRSCLSVNRLGVSCPCRVCASSDPAAITRSA